MKMEIKSRSMVGAVVVVAMLGGCAATGTRAPEAGPKVHGSLVMASPLMLELSEATGGRQAMTGREASRSDPKARRGPRIPDWPEFAFLEQRDRQRLRISNGRPREYSLFDRSVHLRRSER